MNPTLILTLLFLASAVAMMSTDLYAPSLPHLPEYFGASPSTVKLTMSLNALAYAIGTLVHGPLSERFGRRPVLLGGLAAFTLFSLLCALSDTVGQLLAARIAMGFAAAVEGVVVLAIIRDMFDEKDQVRALAFYGMATALPPAIAPVIGGYVFIWFGWQANFYLLAIVAVVVTLLIARQLKETKQPDLDALSWRSVRDDYLHLFTNVQFLRYTIIGGATWGFFFAFITAGPFILIDQHRLPTEHFGYFQALIVIAYMAGSWLAERLIRFWSTDQVMFFGIVIAVVGTALFVFVVYGGHETPLSLAIALAIIAFADGPVFATTPSLAMNASSSRTGPAAAVLLGIEIGMGALASLAVSVMHDGTSRPLAITVTALCLLIVVPYFAGRSR